MVAQPKTRVVMTRILNRDRSDGSNLEYNYQIALQP